MQNMNGMSARDAALLQSYLEGWLRKEIGLHAGELDIGLGVAKRKFETGSHDEAMTVYCGMVLLEPTNTTYLLGLANCAALMGQPELALRSASAVIALEPQNPRGYFFSGQACLALGHLPEAEEDLREALALAEEASDAAVVKKARMFLAELQRARAAAASPKNGSGRPS